MQNRIRQWVRSLLELERTQTIREKTLNLLTECKKALTETWSSKKLVPDAPFSFFFSCKIAFLNFAVERICGRRIKQDGQKFSHSCQHFRTC